LPNQGSPSKIFSSNFDPSFKPLEHSYHPSHDSNIFFLTLELRKWKKDLYKPILYLKYLKGLVRWNNWFILANPMHLVLGFTNMHVPLHMEHPSRQGESTFKKGVRVVMKEVQENSKSQDTSNLSRNQNPYVA
jgi:hypothetical protein